MPRAAGPVLAACLAALALVCALAPVQAVLPVPTSSAATVTNVVRRAFPPDAQPSLRVHSWHGVVPSTGRSFVGHVALLSNPRLFGYALMHDNCYVHYNTSTTAKHFDCLYATNAGLFGYPVGGCVGNVIINGSTLVATNDDHPNFGLTDSEYIVGTVTEKDLQNGMFPFQQVVQGVGWLVHSGISWVKHSPGLSPTSPFTTEKAPRTGVAFANNGSLIILEVDGQEDIHAGLDLFEFAEVMIQVGAHEAVNFDGGGSSVSVYNNKVISRPTCVDTSVVCERAVTTITCVQQLDSWNK